MNFYKTIAKYYDDIFPLNHNTLYFLNNFFIDKYKLLDIACATGTYVNHLSMNNHQVEGIDLDEDMIMIAKEKYNNQFYLENMLNINYHNNFDGVYCIGNSLVHLNSLEEIKVALFKMHQALKIGGKLVLQIINYDRIINKNITSLPTIKNDRIEFIREYNIKDNIVNFNATLKCFEGEFFATTKLLILFEKELRRLLETNFTNIISYDGFSEKPFEINNSIQLVITAERRF